MWLKLHRLDNCVRYGENIDNLHTILFFFLGYPVYIHINEREEQVSHVILAGNTIND